VFDQTFHAKWQPQVFGNGSGTFHVVAPWALAEAVFAVPGAHVYGFDGRKFFTNEERRDCAVDASGNGDAWPRLFRRKMKELMPMGEDQTAIENLLARDANKMLVF
jgi:hypothetical protein